MKHTPGPWKIDEAENLPLAVIRDDEDGEGIAEIGERTPENVANANLIAAAPELLTMLEEMHKEYGKLHDGLSDMIGDGEGQQRLFPEDIPDDYQWLADTLTGLVGVSHRCGELIKKAKGGKS